VDYIKSCPSFLSASALIAYENMPATFALERLALNPKPRTGQNVATAAGSAFDYFIKKYYVDLIDLARDVNREPRFSTTAFKERVLKGILNGNKQQMYRMSDLDVFQIMWQESVEESFREEMQVAGKLLFDSYRANGLNSLVLTDIEVHRHHVIRRDDKLPNPVPVFCKLDAVCALRDKQLETLGFNLKQLKETVSINCTCAPWWKIPDDHTVRAPFDWKTTGYKNPDGASIKPYYAQSWRSGVPEGPHKDYLATRGMHEIDDKWALQLCTYGWALGVPIGVEFLGVIDQIGIRQSGLHVGRYIAPITREYQFLLLGRYSFAWEDLQSGRFISRLPKVRHFLETMAMDERYWAKSEFEIRQDELVTEYVL
jgi:hypothetical protein